MLLSGGVILPAENQFAAVAKQSKAEALGEMALKENYHAKTRYQAMEHIKQALALEPNNPQLLYVKATILRLMEEDDEALVCIAQAIKLDPTNGLYWNVQAELLKYFGNFEKALESANLAVKLAPAEDSFQFSKARLLSKMMRYKESEAILDKLVAKNPKNDMFRDCRILAVEPQQKWNKVIEDATVFLKTNNNHKVSWYLKYMIRANAYEKLKQYQNAVDDCCSAITLFPDRRDAHKKLVGLYTLMGDQKSAIAEQKLMNTLDEDMSLWK